MNKATIRVFGVTALSAVALGFAAPAATAAEAHEAPRPTAATVASDHDLRESARQALQAPEAEYLTQSERETLEAVADGTATEAQQRGVVKIIIKLMGKIPGVKGAVRKGWGHFSSWFDDNVPSWIRTSQKEFTKYEIYSTLDGWLS
ncbi:hypothetical protein [Nocardiopsis baichengensis]|uniref:hypothetical protein n=1 Tax=Nocardiopsis baichengensis TaxID=280240 RepID=UPI00034CE4B6|nr:hypothetical protein [Nocardiopsis baichengensis]